ncbi:MAG: hypothetical protein QM708_01350 [Propioniciclava sp.]|uniref:hypothetical protein n=1 Tax=Propioniciclava sp. TaxID=2038686 RepID=UPI0039E7163A
MTEPQTPSPDEAREQLDLIAQSRRATALATRRPAWMDALQAVILGSAFGLFVAGHFVAGIIAFITAIAVVLVAQRRLRHRGELNDGRAIGYRLLRAAPMYAVVVTLGQIRPTDWPWYPTAAGFVIAALLYLWLRAEERYRIRRLSAGDYGRYDVI